MDVETRDTQSADPAAEAAWYPLCTALSLVGRRQRPRPLYMTSIPRSLPARSLQPSDRVALRLQSASVAIAAMLAISACRASTCSLAASARAASASVSSSAPVSDAHCACCRSHEPCGGGDQGRLKAGRGDRRQGGGEETGGARTASSRMRRCRSASSRERPAW